MIYIVRVLFLWLFVAAVQASDNPRVIVITDIGTEPDDIQSMVRLLTYSNDLDIEGLIASTSRHITDRTHPEFIQARINAYARVLPNLRIHDPSYPSAEYLTSVVRGADPIYGMEGVGGDAHQEAVQLIIDAVDRDDPRPVWISIWGGAAPLAQALHRVKTTRTAEALDLFVDKLRVYSISDQDDASSWARVNFPSLFWITSMHAYGQYGLSTWIGIMSPIDDAMTSNAWLTKHIRSHGPLGATYPLPIFGVEGDTPSFLYLLPNGLGVSEHPNWGSWGGRYDRWSDYAGLWTDTSDTIKNNQGSVEQGNAVTVRRWRNAFQADFAARMDWSITDDYEDANHKPVAMLQGEKGINPVFINACPGEEVTLSAHGSSDPDADDLEYQWLDYKEITGMFNPGIMLSSEFGESITVKTNRWVQPSKVLKPDAYPMHVILSVIDHGEPRLTSYRRAIINVLTKGGLSDSGVACEPIDVGAAPAVTDFTETIIDSSVQFSTDISKVKELLANTAAKQVLIDFLGKDMVERLAGPVMGMTLQGVKHFSPTLTDELLDKIDEALALIPAEQDLY